jgi:hypothetical protein
VKEIEEAIVKGFDRMTVELAALNNSINRLNKNLQTATEGVFSGCIISAKIIKAGNTYDYNNLCKEATQTQTAMSESFIKNEVNYE